MFVVQLLLIYAQIVLDTVAILDDIEEWPLEVVEDGSNRQVKVGYNHI